MFDWYTYYVLAMHEVLNLAQVGACKTVLGHS